MMLAINRLKQYENESFDTVIMDIKTGKIKPGRYSKLVKVKKNCKIEGN